jgi:putative nucleotidyltransferase with HDIG domain
VAAAAAALLAAALFAATGGAERAEQGTIDVRFELRGERAAEGVAVVGIDDHTFSEIRRQWPFPRGLHAQAIDRLREAGVRHVVYDVQFTEPSARPGQDLALFAAVRRARDVVLATGESDPFGRTRVLGGDANLRRAGAVAAAANLPTEPGGVIRRYTHRAVRLDTIATATARRLGSPVDPGDFDDDGALIDFRGPAGTVPTHSFSDLLQGEVPAEALRDRIVVVGATSPTLQDVHPTSAGGLMSGPEIQANAILTALDGNPLRAAPGWVKWLLVLVLGVAGPLLVLRLGPVRGAAAAAGLLALHCAAAQLAFAGGTVLPVFAPLLALGAATIAAVLAVAARERAERRVAATRADALEAAVLSRTRDLETTNLEAVERLARAAELRDDVTGDHIGRMSHLCERVALQLGEPPASARLLRQAAILHDVGKIGLPDGILRKPGRLTDEEVEIMRRHTGIGAELLRDSRSPLMQLAEEIARTHHERWDGSGYPAGLEADEIPRCGRIAAVCDVFDALISERSYKRAWTVEEARAELVAQRGRHFDPEVVDAMLAVIDAEYGPLRSPSPAAT